MCNTAPVLQNNRNVYLLGDILIQEMDRADYRSSSPASTSPGAGAPGSRGPGHIVIGLHWGQGRLFGNEVKMRLTCYHCLLSLPLSLSLLISFLSSSSALRTPAGFLQGDKYQHLG